MRVLHFMPISELQEGSSLSRRERVRVRAVIALKRAWSIVDSIAHPELPTNRRRSRTTLLPAFFRLWAKGRF
jgi:hypothetical protein